MVKAGEKHLSEVGLWIGHNFLVRRIGEFLSNMRRDPFAVRFEHGAHPEGAAHGDVILRRVRLSICLLWKRGIRVVDDLLWRCILDIVTILLWEVACLS